ncbi:hypothetical protein [Halobacillus litoralis]|uniref:hypothetical protein n=1 Tax=Halobacillus litoralis TaxID=45668 RepID=UPI000FFC6B2D|nr:hypothetical protein [Halobacillus litoralis]
MNYASKKKPSRMILSFYSASLFRDNRNLTLPPLGQVIYLTELAETVHAASIHRKAIREKQQQISTVPLD